MWKIALTGPPSPCYSWVKKVCSVLQNPPILLGGCRVLSYIRGRGLLREEPPRWGGIIKVWMFWALDTGPPCVTASGKTLCYITNIRYPRQPDWVIVGKGKYGSFVANWRKSVLSHPRFERGCSHENLMAHVEQSKALSHKAKLIAFLFKATKMSETTKLN
jgi:hypothetical protein